jgi:hypothetical protein
MEQRRRNWFPWLGFVTSLIAALSYFLFFFQFPITRDVPWVNFLLFALAAVLLVAGLRRAFGRDASYRRKISAPVLTALSAVIFGLFSFVVFVGSRQLPASQGAPHPGQKAPQFSLSDASGKPVSLSQLLSAPIDPGAGVARAPKGVLLIFYRGYW